jgi:hypothetical protein
MKTFSLTIRRTPLPVHKPAAWFVRGSSAGDWLDEIAQWGVPFASLTLYLVPLSPADPRPLGALVKVDRNLTLAVSPRALPYACIAGRFYLPIDAIVSPPVGDAELASLMGPEREAYVWHPAIGLCGFDAGEGCPVSRLIELPAPRESDWGHALPGLSINQRLWSVEPEALPSVEVVMQELRDDIGSEADDLSQLPALPDEPSPSLLARMADRTRQGCASVASWLSSLLPGTPRAATADAQAERGDGESDDGSKERECGEGGSAGLFSRMTAAAKQGAARAGLWLLSFLPRTASSPTWANRLSDRLSRLIDRIRLQADLHAPRMRELRRLLRLLADDPDRGLKFAIPLMCHRIGPQARRGLNFFRGT